MRARRMLRLPSCATLAAAITPCRVGTLSCPRGSNATKWPLQRLGCRHVMVVRGADGMDEITISEPTMVGELKDGELREYTIQRKRSATPTLFA